MMEVANDMSTILSLRGARKRTTVRAARRQHFLCPQLERLEERALLTGQTVEEIIGMHLLHPSDAQLIQGTPHVWWNDVPEQPTLDDVLTGSSIIKAGMGAYDDMLVRYTFDDGVRNDPGPEIVLFGLNDTESTFIGNGTEAYSPPPQDALYLNSAAISRYTIFEQQVYAPGPILFRLFDLDELNVPAGESITTLDLRTTAFFGIGAFHIFTDGSLTNRMPDPLAEVSASAFSAPAQVSASAVTGDVTVVIPTITGPLADSASLVYSEHSYVESIDAVVPELPGGTTDWIYAEWSIASDSSYSFNPSGLNHTSGSSNRFLLNFGSGLDAGTYGWEFSVYYNYTGPETGTTVTYRGIRSMVNRAESPYGAQVWINGLDKLDIQEADEGSDLLPMLILPYWHRILYKPKGITYVQSDGTAAFFAFDEGTQKYVAPPGYFFTLVEEQGGYTIENPQRLKKHFSADGLLESVTEPNGNVTSYQYNPDDTVASITDPFGRTVEFGYANGKLDTITDAAERVTDVQMVGGTLVGITSPVPEDGRPPLDTSLTSSSITLPSGEQVQFEQTQLYLTSDLYDARIGAEQKYFINSADSQPAGDHDFLEAIRFVADPEEYAATIYEDSLAGDTATIKVDDRGWVVEYTDFKGDTTKYERYDNGLVKSITLPGGSEPQYLFTYDDNGNMLTRTSKATMALPQDAVEIWTYDPTWNVPDTYTDPYGNVTSYDIDPSNGQVRMIEQQVLVGPAPGTPTDLLTNFYYTPGGGGVPAGLLQKVVGPNELNGSPLETRYDYMVDNGQFIQIVTEAYGTPQAIQQKYVYDLNTMNLVQYVDARQFVTDYQYDDLDRLRKVIEPSPDGAAPRPDWEYRYYDNGLLKETEDPRDKITGYEYTFFFGGSLSSYTVKQPKPTPQEQTPTWIEQYDTMGRLDRGRDPRGNWTDYEYDPNGNLSKVEQPVVDGARPTWIYLYNTLGLLDEETDPEQNTTNYHYDDRGQLLDVEAPMAPDGQRPKTKYSYDQRGLVTQVEDPMGRKTTYVYDEIGRLTRVEGPDPAPGDPRAITTYQYDNGGNVRFETVGAETPLAQTTEYRYDELDRLRAVIQPAPTAGAQQPTTLYTYYDTGEQHTLTDPNGNVTTWTIDNLGRVTSEAVSWSSHARTYGYDAAGNLKQKVDRNGRAISYDYDDLNRMTAEKWFPDEAGIGSTPLRTLSYGYDLAGNLETASDPAASYTYSYDSLNRPNITTAALPGLPVVALDNDYDKNGNRTELYATIGSTPDFHNHYEYDDLNRLVDLEQQEYSVGGNAVAFKQVGFAYNAAGQVTVLNRFNHFVEDPSNPNGRIVATGYEYDETGRLYIQTHNLPAGPPIFQAWDYDVLGRVTQYYNEDDTPQLYQYDYDDNNQLTHEIHGNDVEISYDLGGNRTGSYTPGAGNRVQSDGTNTYLYDEEGNLKKRTNTTTGVVTNYSWDHRNRLVTVQVVMPGYPAAGSYNVSYTYDALDRRVAWQWVTYLVGQFGILYPDQIYRQEFVYDGDDVVFDFESLNLGPYALARRYLHGPAVDQVFAQENIGEDISAASRVYWLLDDLQGTTRDIVDHTGGVVQQFAYTAFGEIVGGDPTLTRYLYTGREFDFASELQYNRARWIDAGTGSWASEDPTGFGGGDANLYRYVWNSPTNGRDAYGVWGELEGGRRCIVSTGKGTRSIEITPGSVYDPEIGGADAGADSLISLQGWWGFFTGWERRARGDGTYYWRKFSDPYSVDPKSGNLQAPAYADRALEEVGNDVQNGIAIAGAISGASARGNGARGGESRAAANGRQVHEAFKETVRAKPGWQSEPRLVDPKTGKTAIPDALSPSGRPVELKPKTPSGRASGASQLRKYERATGKSGRVIYYDP